ncbi:hypothetical protein [Paenibacillus ehimensis]|uniref:Uncharacterized protein n=1 Tax=Paenibacillus ehimensis TaxID=79264 RepID=A0ABT8V8S0_9BACL|nr:hypothetical protein [Paenibacillus ehimensis]MDO3676236.1 hypothetical protein [Paenibacillus ehimensis]MEC0210083.1 hypothetical protein [Paenibacillus ehimensis]
MEWNVLLSKYEGSRITVWIEDLSGEEQTQPKPFTLFKTALTDNHAYLQFYFNADQFLSVPLFDDPLTKLERGQAGDCFVSHDLQANLRYHIYFEERV